LHVFLFLKTFRPPAHRPFLFILGLSAAFRVLAEENVKSNMQKIANSRVLSHSRGKLLLLFLITQVLEELMPFNLILILKHTKHGQKRMAKVRIDQWRTYTSMGGCMILKKAEC